MTLRQTELRRLLEFEAAVAVVAAMVGMFRGLRRGRGHGRVWLLPSRRQHSPDSRPPTHLLFAHGRTLLPVPASAHTPGMHRTARRVTQQTHSPAAPLTHAPALHLGGSFDLCIPYVHCPTHTHAPAHQYAPSARRLSRQYPRAPRWPSLLCSPRRAGIEAAQTE